MGGFFVKGVDYGMKKLFKTIDGADCEIYAIKNHQRVFIGKATPTIEIYQNITEVDVLGKTSSQCKTYEFSLIICSDPELDKKITPDFLDGLTHFDLKTLLKNKDNVFIPFEFAGLAKFTIEEYNKWIFDVNNYDLTKILIDL